MGLRKTSVFITIVKCLKIALLSLGIFSLLLIILSFTSFPYWTRYWLGTHYLNNNANPEYIIMFGGSGMPSEDNLIRLYHTASLANHYKLSKIIIAHPKDSFVYTKMKHEIVIRGIDSSRIAFEPNGTNTRSQVLSISSHYPCLITSKIIVVTSAEQVYRTVKSFHKAGYKYVSGIPAFNNDMHVDLSYKSKKLGGKTIIPDIGDNLKLRYNFWNYLKMEISCLREFSAIVYYKLNGWI